MDGAGNIPMLQQGQTELARQLSRLNEQVGTLTEKVNDRVTHRELMSEFGGFRKEFSGKLDHMEEKFDQAAEKVDTSLEKAIDRIKEGLGNLAARAVTEAMAIREQQESKAAALIQAREADIDRRLRRADRNGYIGGGVGIIGIIAAVFQYLSHGAG